MKAAKFGTACLMSLLLSACSGHLFSPENCPNKTVTVKTKRGGVGTSSSMNIYPATIKVRAGCDFRVKFPPGTNGSTANNSGQNWLNKPSTPRQVVITVPADKTVGEEFKYAIKVDGFGEIDPRIRVVR